MSKVITFSRVYPKHHPKAGQPTYFVEKIHNSLQADTIHQYNDYHGTHEMFCDLNNIDPDFLFYFKSQLSLNMSLPKYHTIRAGHRWKVGDKFSPRVWSGKPYNSKQIIIAPDIEIKKVWNVHIENDKDTISVWIVGEGKGNRYIYDVSSLSMNDGLSLQDFIDWFNKDTFDGQIICWNEDIEY